jgi:hypothetical protein
LWGLFVVGSVSCTSPDPRPTRFELNGVDKDGQSYYVKVFYYPYESVWRAAQLSLKYPIAINNMDNGVLETEWIKALDGYTSPLGDFGGDLGGKPLTEGYRYKLSLTMVKGRVDNRPSVRVTIRKKIEKLKDFFSDVENVASDSLEEKVVLYRIEREIIIDEAIKRAAKAANSQSN